MAGRYLLLSRLGQGRFGTVWLGRDVLDGTEVAVKIPVSGPEGAEARAREAAVLSALDLPGLPRLLHEDGQCLVTTFIPGEPFRTSGRPRPAWAAGVARKAAEILGKIHEAGYVHGDLTPEHVRVDEDRSVSLLDFSLSFRSDSDTKAGRGTPGYMAPENLRGQACTPRADVYSLGAVLYEALAGVLPLAAATPGEEEQERARGGPVPLSDPVSPALSKVVMQALAPRPADRFPNGTALAEALAAVPEGLKALAPEFSGRFVGRAQELDQALQAYFRIAQGGATALVVRGVRGVGKTRFLWELGHALAVFGPPLHFLRCRGLSIEEARARATALLATHGPAGEKAPVLLLDDVEDFQTLAAVQEQTARAKSAFWVATTSPAPAHAFTAPLDLLPLKAADLTLALASRLGVESASDIQHLVAASGGLPGVALGVLDAAGPEGLSSWARPFPAGRAVQEAFAGRVLRLSGDDLNLLLALAVTGEEAPFAVAARVAGQRIQTARKARDRFLRDGFLFAQGEVLAFPIAGAAAVLARAVPHRLRLDWHLAAAKLMRKGGESAHGAAVHFFLAGDVPAGLRLFADPGAEPSPQAIQALSAARTALPLGSLAAKADALLGRLLAKTQKLDEAASRLDSALAFKGWNRREREDLSRAAAEIHLARGNWQGVLSSLAMKDLSHCEDSALLIIVGEALRGLGRFEDAQEILGTALVLPRLQPKDQAQCRHLLGLVSLDQGLSCKAEGNLEQAIAGAKEAEDAKTEIRAFIALAQAHLSQGDFSGAGGRLLRARETNARRSTGLDQEIELVSSLHTCHTGDFRRGLGLLHSLFDRAAQRPPAFRAAVLEALGQAYALRGNLRQSQGYLGRARDLFRLSGDTPGSLRATARAALVALRAGDRATAEACLPPLQAREEPAFEAVAGLIRACRHLEEGDGAKALTETGEALARIPDEEQLGPVRGFLLRCEALARLAAKDHLAARETFAKALAALRPYPVGALEAAVDLAREVGATPKAPVELVSWARDAVLACRKNLPRVEDELLDLRAAKALGELEATVPDRPGTALSAALATGAPDPQNPAAELAKLRKREKSLLVLQSVTRRINRESDYTRLLDMIMDMALSAIGAQRGFILAGPKKMGVLAARNMEEGKTEADTSLSFSIALEVVETQRPILTADACQDDRFKERVSVKDLALRSVLCVPLLGPQGAVGAVYAEDRNRPGAFREHDLWFLSLFADQAAVALENARLGRRQEEDRRELDRLNRELSARVKQQARSIADLESRVASAPPKRYADIEGRSPAMEKVFALLDRITPTQAPVLITGASGTGKELVARAIHFHGPRKDRTFAAENCAALTETLLESELFGHEKGAFTGAVALRKGLFEQAHQGTLFLDEVADMSPGLQKKLLRVLQEGEIRRVGGRDLISVDVRIISASNRDLEEIVTAGRFREDLFYRLNVLRIDLPPLSKRREDIALLVKRFLEGASTAEGEPRRITEEALSLLQAYDWPGNVRELQNEILRAAALGGAVIGPDDLSPRVRESLPSEGSLDLREKVQELETKLIRDALARTGGNKSSAARLLGLSRFGLQKKMQRFGL
jgi:transcriptional regulator with GAF, ATPase, and Fis domain